MSMYIHKHIPFLDLVLSTTKEQALALLSTVTDKQLNALSEIAYNLLNITHSIRKQDQVKKRKHLLKQLSSPKLSPTKKRKAIQQHKRQLLKVLTLFKTQLKALL